MPPTHEDGTSDMPGRDRTREDGKAADSSGGANRPGHLRLVTSPAEMHVGQVIHSMRKWPRPGHPRGLTVAEAARRTGVCGQTPISARLWSRIEQGRTHPQAGVLLRMALAIDATPGQIHRLFHLTGYGQLYDTLAGVGTSAARRYPRPAEAGILADPRLPDDKRQALLEHVRDILDALEMRAHREEDEDGPARP